LNYVFNEVIYGCDMKKNMILYTAREQMSSGEGRFTK